MKKRMLALAVMSTVFSVGFVMSANAAENADQKLSQYSVDEVIVEGSRDLLPGGFVKSTSNVGIRYYGQKIYYGDTVYESKSFRKSYYCF